MQPSDLLLIFNPLTLYLYRLCWCIAEPPKTMAENQNPFEREETLNRTRLIWEAFDDQPDQSS